jgi:hypothetical protein
MVLTKEKNKLTFAKRIHWCISIVAWLLLRLLRGRIRCIERRLLLTIREGRLGLVRLIGVRCSLLLLLLLLQSLLWREQLVILSEFDGRIRHRRGLWLTAQRL